MSRKLTTRIVAERLNMPQKEVLRRIRIGHIPARKFDWIWVVDEDDIPTIMAEEWYQRYRVSA